MKLLQRPRTPPPPPPTERIKQTDPFDQIFAIAKKLKY
jgi:hypothetical protein